MQSSKEGNGFNGVVPLETYGSTDDREAFIGKDPLQDTSLVDGLEFYSNNNRPDAGTYFEDGKRKIDYVLVYIEETASSDKQEQQNKEYRNKFLNNLKKAGLQMEDDIVESEKKTYFYIKLHAPWDILCWYAEELNFRAPLQAHPNPSSNWSEKLLAKLRIPNFMSQEVPNTPLDFFTCPFKKSKLDRFLDSSSQDTFFSNTERSRIVMEILHTSVYGKRKKAEVGIERMLEEGIFDSAFPIHDGPYEIPNESGPAETLNRRQVLYEYWARWGKWYKYQPVDHIREYFGEKIGIYFAWLGFYTGWLLPASIVGLLVFMYGVITIDTNVPAKEICNSGDAYLMCPLCDESIGCQYWNLSDICLQATVAYLFDHPGTVFYAVFMSFWAVMFLEYWKRKQCSLAHHWDCMDFEEDEERPRPAFCISAPYMEKNPVTGQKEPAFPDDIRLRRVATGIIALFAMASLVIIFLIGVILYRVLVSIPLFQSSTLRSEAQTVASLTGAFINLIFIMLLSKVYDKMAVKLNDWEMHRTQTEYEDHLTFKVFVFQFVNYYGSIFYIAFFKGRFNGYPGNYNTLLGLRNEECGQGGCLVELAQQLLVIMVGKQTINNIQEIVVPKLKQLWQKYKVRGSVKEPVIRELAQWESDFELAENEGLFEEYLEMVLQFGFITIFVAAFPLAPMFALLNNWFEIRIDANKLLSENRRIVAERAQDIGVWFNILDALVQLAVVSNAFVIAFTSEFLPRQLYKHQYNWDLTGYVNFTLSYSPPGALNQTCRYNDFRDEEGNYTLFYWQLLAAKLGFVILFEHFVFTIAKLIDFFIPDVPESLEIKIKREKYLAKQALSDAMGGTPIITVPDADDDAQPEKVKDQKSSKADPDHVKVTLDHKEEEEEEQEDDD